MVKTSMVLTSVLALSFAFSGNVLAAGDEDPAAAAAPAAHPPVRQAPSQKAAYKAAKRAGRENAERDNSQGRRLF